MAYCNAVDDAVEVETVLRSQCGHSEPDLGLRIYRDGHEESIAEVDLDLDEARQLHANLGDIISIAERREARADHESASGKGE